MSKVGEIIYRGKVDVALVKDLKKANPDWTLHGVPGESALLYLDGEPHYYLTVKQANKLRRMLNAKEEK